MKRLMSFLIILFLVFPIVLVVAPIRIIGLVCELISFIAVKYLNWADRLVNKF